MNQENKPIIEQNSQLQQQQQQRLQQEPQEQRHLHRQQLQQQHRLQLQQEQRQLQQQQPQQQTQEIQQQQLQHQPKEPQQQKQQQQPQDLQQQSQDLQQDLQQDLPPPQQEQQPSVNKPMGKDLNLREYKNLIPKTIAEIQAIHERGKKLYSKRKFYVRDPYPPTPRELTEEEIQREKLQRKKDIKEYKDTITYSSYYYDDKYEYRHVILPKMISRWLPRTPKLMDREEWLSYGVSQSLGWVHYMVYAPEPHILLFRREIDYTKKVIYFMTCNNCNTCINDSNVYSMALMEIICRQNHRISNHPTSRTNT